MSYSHVWISGSVYKQSVFNFMKYFYLYCRTSLLQGFNATLTEPANTQGVRGGHIRELQSRLHPEIKETLKKLCDDRRTNIVILSGSDRAVLDDVFSYL